MMTDTQINLLIFPLPLLLFIFYIVAKYGVLHSFSESWYVLPNGKKWLFTYTMYFTGFLVIPLYPSIYNLLAGASLAIVGVSTAFRGTNFQKILHFFGALSGIILIQVSWVIVTHNWFPSIMWLLLSIAIIWACDRHEHEEETIWWLEVWSFLLIYVTLIWWLW